MADDGNEHDGTEGGLVSIREPGNLIKMSDHKGPEQGGIVVLAHDLDALLKVETKRAEIAHRALVTKASIGGLFLLIVAASSMALFGSGNVQTGGVVLLTNLCSGILSYLFGVSKGTKRTGA